MAAMVAVDAFRAGDYVTVVEGYQYQYPEADGVTQDTGYLALQCGEI